MDSLKKALGLNTLKEEWCNEMLKDDFCSDVFPDTWSYDISLIGLEEPFRDLLEYISSKKQRIWDHVILTDVNKLQCVTNIVLESCIKGEGSPLTGLLCGACYLQMSSLEGASARNVFHNMLFNKVMELLKVQSDVSSFEGILAVYESLCKLLKSDLTLSDQSFWLLVKSYFASVNLNCSHKKAENNSFNRLFSVILSRPKDFKFFIKEASVYLLAGKCYVGDRSCSLICDFVEKHSDNKRVITHHLNLLYTLCASISDRTEARKQVEAYILKLVSVLPKDCFFEFAEWIVSDLCNSQKVVHRIFGAEMCFQLSFNTIVTEAEDSEVLGSLYQTITFGLSDKAPTVRAKCAMVLSDLLKNAPSASKSSLLPYFEPSVADNILHIIQYLSYDEKSSVRKASCNLILMMLLKIKLRSSWLKIIYRFCLDTAVSVRKQALISVGNLLSNYESHPIVQRLWLETVLPAANDNENSVKDYCNLQLENLLNRLHQSDHAWDILQLISHPKSLDLQTYFDFGVNNLKDFKISSDSKRHLLEKLEETQCTHTVLLLVSKMTGQFKEVNSTNLIEIFERCLLTRSDDSYQTMCLSLSCLRNLKQVTDIDQVVSKLKGELTKFTHPYMVIKELVTTIFNLLHRSDKQEIANLCKESISDIGVVLQNLCLTKTEPDAISSMKFCCYLYTLGELALYFNHQLGSAVVLSVKELIIEDAESSFSTSVRAHSIIALGKICLIHEDIAKDSVMLFSKVLEDDKNFEIRNNVLIVLGDLIVRYPTIIAEYLYCVTDCLQDASVVVRRQAIIVLTKLLQEDYLKWRSGIVMKFISNLVCDDSEIRQLCELCLSNILLVRYPKTYFDFFIEAVFFANGLFSFLTTTEPNLLHFSLPGQENEAKRRKIYTAMLQNLGDQQKLEITTRICKEILSLFVADNDEPIDQQQVPLLKDTLWILCCPSLKLSSLKSRANHDFDDDDSNIGIIEAQTKVISNIVKRNFVENCTPIIIQLRQKLRRLKSPLQNDLTKFIVLFVSEFKNEIEVLSGDDAQFIAEIQYDIEECKKRESNVQRPSTSLLQKSVINNLTTPGFLKGFKTPHTGRGLNLSLANQGPGSFLRSPFFAAPTPHSLSRSVTYKRSKLTTSDANFALRKNLLSDARMKETSTTTVVTREVLVSKSTNENINQGETVPQTSISVHTSSVHQEIEKEDREISYTMETTTIKIVNSPGPSTSFVDNAQEVVGIKEELQSPSEKFTKKAGRNLFNPDASANLQNASKMSDGSMNEGTNVQDPLLLTNKAEKGCVRIKVKMEMAKKVLVSSSSKGPTSSAVSEPLATGQQPKKPMQLGEMIRQKLREQRKKKAELAKANDAAPQSSKPVVVKSEESDDYDSPEKQPLLPSTAAPSIPSEGPESSVTSESANKQSVDKNVASYPPLTQAESSKLTENTKPTRISDVKSDANDRLARRTARVNKLFKVKPTKNAASDKENPPVDQVQPSENKDVQSEMLAKVPEAPTTGNKEEAPSSGSKEEGKSSTENSENTPPESVEPQKQQQDIPTAKTSGDNEAEMVAKRKARMSKILKQFQPKQPTKPSEPVFQKPTAPTRSSKRVNKLLAQLKPKKGPAAAAECIVDKPENILLSNQVLRKRKNPNNSGHCIFQEDDLIPKPKRRSLDNHVNLGNVTFDPHDPSLITSTPAVPLKVRRASERLMRKRDVSFDNSDPGIVASTPFIPNKTSAKNIVSSTPAVVSRGSKRLQMKCDLSPIGDTSKKN